MTTVNDYKNPDSLNGALKVLAKGGWTVLAGGTDLYPSVADAFAWNCAKPMRILDISNIKSLSGIEELKYEFRLGSRVTWAELIEHSLPPFFNTLKLAGREIGGVQIQNRATIAGNICNASPAADGVPALLALDAQVEITSYQHIRRIPISEFVKGNRRTALRDHELVTAIFVPKRNSLCKSTFSKLGARKYLVISIVMVACIIDIDTLGCISHARVVVGSCSEVARRLPALETTLLGKYINSNLTDLFEIEMLKPLSPIDDIRGSAFYRMKAAETLILQSLLELGAGYE